MIGGVCLIWPHSSGSCIMYRILKSILFPSSLVVGDAFSDSSLQLYFENNRTTTLTTHFQLENTLLKINFCGVVFYYLFFILASMTLPFCLLSCFTSTYGGCFLPWHTPKLLWRPMEKSWQKWKMFFSLSFIENRLVSYNIYSLWFALLLPSQFLPSTPCSWINHLSVSP